jgi:hypothetical protein
MEGSPAMTPNFEAFDKNYSVEEYQELENYMGLTIPGLVLKLFRQNRLSELRRDDGKIYRCISEYLFYDAITSFNFMYVIQFKHLPLHINIKDFNVHKIIAWRLKINK